MNNSYVIGEIRKYAKCQLFSAETFETAVMVILTLATAFLIVPQAEGRGLAVSLGMLALFAGITTFGLYETLPALICFWDPYRAGFLQRAGNPEQIREFMRRADAEMREHRTFENQDMSATDSFLILHGRRTFEVLRKEEVISVTQKYYPHRKKNKGMYFFHFRTADGKKHTLDIHTGELYNPERQRREIAGYLEKDLQLKVNDHANNL